MIYLYLKEHNKTGLKYLGKTIQNPFKYKGSGLYWSRHLNKYGTDVTTKILKICKNETELSHWGLYYSNLWDIVESKEFANLIPETGTGHCAGIKLSEETKLKIKNKRKFQIMTKESNQKRSETLKNKYKNTEHFNKNRKQSQAERNMRIIINSGENNPMYNKQHKEESKQKMRGKRKQQKKLTCPYCGLTGGVSPLKSYHFERCKYKPQ